MSAGIAGIAGLTSAAGITGTANSDLSVNGYYLRPSLAYKASTIFGGDEGLAGLLEKGVTVSFTEMLKSGLSEVNALQSQASDLADKFAAGETDNIHEVLIAGEKADIALQLTTAIRSKILDAYQEIMRMQI
ncbi:MAG: flagellar hook-basal body complex protein FliE [Clostridiales bacterium]|jgi:flagellar hook-basal body complex protein FliE|nr:flagellar hook-basal body complex protein FliE [Clostridiales bacterium]